MGRRGILALGLWMGLLVGCTTGRPLASTSWLRQWRSGAEPSGPEVVQMVAALVEGPAGDSFFNKDFWAQADDQILPLEQKALLQENGLRVAQVGGLTPPGLQNLLASERSCANPRLIKTRAGGSTRLTTGPALAACRFQVSQDDRKVTVDLERAECALMITSSLVRDGRVRLQFTPEVRHGKAALVPQPAERANWMLQQQQPTETYPALSWEVTLGSNEYVVVGGRFDRPGTLGHQFFIRLDEAAPRQRMLVIRIARPAASLLPDTDAQDERAGRSPPLALQAVWPIVRGSEP